MLKSADGASECKDLYSICRKHCDYLREQSAKWGYMVDPNMGELAAFVTYAYSFPSGFLALIDTYDVMKSGITNFAAVAIALNELGYRGVGVRLDSGDLAYLSITCRGYLRAVADNVPHMGWIGDCKIVASNDINEETLYSLKNQGHEINVFGVGTHLVTCQAQPALGCVFKLVELNGQQRIKLSEDVEKVNLPGSKEAYRLFGKDGSPLVDLMQNTDEGPPDPGRRVLCRHPFIESKRAYVVPAKVEKLHHLFWDCGKVVRPLPNLNELRVRAYNSVARMRPDHVRHLNPTPYKVSVSEQLYTRLHSLWLTNAPVGELT